MVFGVELDGVRSELGRRFSVKENDRGKVMTKLLMMGLLSILMAICGQVFADDLDDAVANTGRLDAEKKLDERRHPDGVLRFLGVEPGMAVFDVFAGGGYYTEILSYLVGPEGYVVHYNNAPWEDFVKKGTEARFKGNRLPNVERLVAPPEALRNHAAEFDAAIFVLGMHDIYYADPETGWVAIDVAKFASGIFDLLKPGGVLGVIDHNGLPGADTAVAAEQLHRVDPAIIIADLTSAGFVLEASSDLLANAEDD
ncbi:MAG: putative methyltransferase, partial [Litorivivens sp.]